MCVHVWLSGASVARSLHAVDSEHAGRPVRGGARGRGRCPWQLDLGGGIGLALDRVGRGRSGIGMGAMEGSFMGEDGKKAESVSMLWAA